MRTLVVGLALVGMALVGCTDDGGESGGAPPQPEPRPLEEGARDEVGTCRGQVAQQEAAGMTDVDWVQLGAEVPETVDRVFRATGIEDQGERDIYPDEVDDGIELPRGVHFTGVTGVLGEATEPVDSLSTELQVVDAEVLLEEGAELLVWDWPPFGGGPRFASLVAVEADGGVVFLGDCRPKWTPAFAA